MFAEQDIFYWPRMIQVMVSSPAGARGLNATSGGNLKTLKGQPYVEKGPKIESLKIYNAKITGR